MNLITCILSFITRVCSGRVGGYVFRVVQRSSRMRLFSFSNTSLIAGVRGMEFTGYGNTKSCTAC